MAELTEERVRGIAREEILKREMEKVSLIAKIDASAKEMVKESNKESINYNVSA